MDDVYEVEPEEANMVVIFSDAFGAKNIRLKVWLDVPQNMGASAALSYVSYHYGDYVDTNVRIDFYNARLGKVIGR